MKTNLLLVASGGAIGSLLRYITALSFTKVFPPDSIPFSTLVINIAGSLLIGIVFGMAERFQWMTPALRLFLATGICGGYTTFSAFAYENVSLLQKGNFTGFALYASLSFILTLAAAFAGVSLARLL